MRGGLKRSTRFSICSFSGLLGTAGLCAEVLLFADFVCLNDDRILCYILIRFDISDEVGLNRRNDGCISDIAMDVK